MKYIKEFTKSRSKKLGASEISACIPHPEKPGSVSGYEQTALTVWEEKTGRTKRDPAGFAAEMGNILEPVILKKWISENHSTDPTESKKVSDEFYRGYMLCELDKKEDGYPNAESFQNTNYLHHTKAENDFAIAHADLINPKKKILTEAKSASFWSARRNDDIYSGYDLELKGNQGIPLKHYFQVQFQSAIYREEYGIKFEKLFLALLFDTSRFHSWEIIPDVKIQERLLEISSYMKKCIDKDTPPKILAMNQKDIKIMYPEINEDYRIVSGEELEKAVELAKMQKHASDQEKIWKMKKEESIDSLSIILKDSKIVKGIIEGEISDIASWEERSGSERIISLKEIKNMEKQNIYKYLLKNDLIKKGESSKFVKVKYKDKIK